MIKKTKKILNLWSFFYLEKTGSPWSAMIYLTSKCNLNCPMCWRHTDFGKKYVADPELTIKEFKSVITEIHELGCKKVSFAGGGEPLVHKDFLELARLAKSFDMECDLVTNGTLLNESIASELKKINWDNVYLSLDGHTKEINNKIRGRGFDEAVRTIKLLKRANINTIIACVIHPFNYKYLDKMVEFAHYNGVKTVNFQPYMELNEKLNRNIKEELPSHLEKALRKSEELKIQTNLKDLIEFGSVRIMPKMKCILPWIQIQIDDKGNVRPCCVLYQESWGNIKEKSLKEIWTNGFTKIRRDFKKGKLAIECINCPPASYKFNKKIFRLLLNF